MESHLEVQERSRFVRSAIVAALLLGAALVVPFLLFDGAPVVADDETGAVYDLSSLTPAG